MQEVVIAYKEEYSFRERMLLWLLGNVIPMHARLYSKRKAWGLLREDMLAYPDGSLGRELGNFLTRENLQPIDRIERHDAFHILLGFDTTLTDEAAMQFFLTGNGKRSPFTLATTLFTALVMPDKWRVFYKAYQRGSRARCIARWDFLTLLDQPFEDVKAFIYRQPVANRQLLDKLALYY